MAIRGVVDLPLVVDADTGFGNALNVAHAVRTLERAGASAIQLEDRQDPEPAELEALWRFGCRIHESRL
jgi:2-methylisocitrate lyase-like PEP mutase family enzyme